MIVQSRMKVQMAATSTWGKKFRKAESDGGRRSFRSFVSVDRSVVADGESLPISQVMATAQDSQHRYRQQIPGRNRKSYAPSVRPGSP